MAGRDRFCRRCGSGVRDDADRAVDRAFPDEAETVAALQAEPERVPSAARPSIFRRARSWRGTYIIGAALLIAALGAVAYVLLRPGDSTPTKTRLAVEAGRTAVIQPTQLGLKASKLADVREVGAAARDRLGTVRREIAELGRIKSDRYHSAALSTLSAEQVYLTQLSRLADLRDSRLKDWNAIEGGLHRASLEIQQTRPEIAALHLNAGAGLIPSALTLDQSVDALDTLIGKADRQLTRWRHHYATAKAEKADDLAVVTNYGNTMRGYLDRYSQQRTDMQQWIDKVDSEGATFAEAYQFLGDASTARAGLKSSISSLSPPAVLGAAHNQMVHVLGESIAAIDDATSGTADYEFDSGDSYSNYKDAPGWQAFEDASGRISREYGSVRSQWEGQLAGRIGSIQKRQLPRRPNV